MRARITYLMFSPRTPRWIAQRTTEALGLLAAAAGLLAVASGVVGHVLFSLLVIGGAA